MESLNTLDIENQATHSNEVADGKGSSYSSSSCSFEGDNDDNRVCDIKGFPQGFENLISKPLTRSPKKEQASPNECYFNSSYHKALSFPSTSTNSKMCTRLFGGDTKSSSLKRHNSSGEGSNGRIKRRKIVNSEENEKTSIYVSVPQIRQNITQSEETNCVLLEQDLIGDSSGIYSLPLVQSRHNDLKAISPQTMAQLINESFRNIIGSYKIIDGRFPYEYEGGHITGAVNLYTRKQCKQLLNDSQTTATHSNKREILLFHCEFSSELGPNLYRYLRQKDRIRNTNASLKFPEIYLLEGGYKKFFTQFPEMCTPMAYKQMLHADHKKDLKYFRRKSKTCISDSRRGRSTTRPLTNLK